MGKKTPIGRMLIEKRAIDQAQLSRALEQQQRSGGRIASNLLALGLAGEEDLLQALGEQLGVPAVDLTRSVVPLEVLDLIPEPVAKEANVLPLRMSDDKILLAMANPEDRQTIDEVRFVTGKRVEPCVVLEARLRQVVHEAYALRKRDSALLFYRGERSGELNEQENPAGSLFVITQALPEPTISMGKDEELISIEVSPEDEIPAPVSPATGGKDGKVVLVVDDEPEILRLLERALMTEGFAVVTASRGLEALRAVKAHQPQLVLLDAMLPEIHGFEICKKIKTSKRFGHIPVVMISAFYKGWRFAEDVKKTYGADDYFEKPFRIVPLLRRVKELLNEGHPAMAPEADSESANQAYQRGVALFKEGKLEPAEQALREACQLDPFSANVRFALANILMAANKVYDAIREYEATVELKPDLFAPLRNLAILYQKKGFKNKALEMWERALRSSPDEKVRQDVREQILKLL